MWKKGHEVDDFISGSSGGGVLINGAGPKGQDGVMVIGYGAGGASGGRNPVYNRYGG